jgi:hypothetical protein
MQGQYVALSTTPLNMNPESLRKISYFIVWGRETATLNNLEIVRSEYKRHEGETKNNPNSVVNPEAFVFLSQLSTNPTLRIHLPSCLHPMRIVLLVLSLLASYTAAGGNGPDIFDRDAKLCPRVIDDGYYRVQYGLIPISTPGDLGATAVQVNTEFRLRLETQAEGIYAFQIVGIEDFAAQYLTDDAYLFSSMFNTRQTGDSITSLLLVERAFRRGLAFRILQRKSSSLYS